MLSAVDEGGGIMILEASGWDTRADGWESLFYSHTERGGLTEPLEAYNYVMPVVEYPRHETPLQRFGHRPNVEVYRFIGAESAQQQTIEGETFAAETELAEARAELREVLGGERTLQVNGRDLQDLIIDTHLAEARLSVARRHATTVAVGDATEHVRQAVEVAGEEQESTGVLRQMYQRSP